MPRLSRGLWVSAASEKQKVARAAGVIGVATLASRVFGFIRDLVIAYFFGAGPAADAFFVAFRIPNLMRRLFAEGTLTIAFIPVFTEVLRKKGRQEAMMLARATYTLLSLVLAVICVLGVIWADYLVRVIAPGFDPAGQTYQLAVLFTRWCLPFIFLISLMVLASGVLNSLGHFFAPAVAPALFNICVIVCAYSLADRVDPPVLALAIGVLVGGLGQLLLQIPYLKARDIDMRPLWQPANPALRRVLRLMGPAAFGAAVYQLAVFINTQLASLLPVGSVSYLYYADRLIQFPLGIFAIAVSTAILPSLSRQAADGDKDGLVDTMGYGLRLTMFITVPAMVGLIVLAQPLVVLLFARGEFGLDTARATAGAVIGYGVGLWAFAGLRSVVQAFYALKDTKTPVKIAAACLVINVAASLSLMWWLGPAGLALATSLAGMANLLLLLWLLRKRTGPLGGRRIMRSCAYIAVCSAAMGALCWAVVSLPDWGAASGWLSKYVRPLAAMAAGLLSYLLLAWALRMKELGELMAVLGRRRK